jgi:hypothetical protein
METTSFMPRELVAKCIFILHQFHKKAGYSSLAGLLLSDKKTMAIVTEHEDLLRIAEAAVTSRRVKHILWLTVLPLLFIVCWLIYPPGINSGLLVAAGSLLLIIVQRYFARRERECYIWIAAIMLAMEMLANNFADLATRFPSAAMSAELTLRLHNRSPTLFLDAYMPKRDELDLVALKAFSSFG